jgi:hypothetical protein
MRSDALVEHDLDVQIDGGCEPECHGSQNKIVQQNRLEDANTAWKQQRKREAIGSDKGRTKKGFCDLLAGSRWPICGVQTIGLCFRLAGVATRHSGRVARRIAHDDQHGEGSTRDKPHAKEKHEMER